MIWRNYEIGFLPIIAGVIFDVTAPILVYFGNPVNMGMCAACFTRDIAGAISLHQIWTLQYIRPEIISLIFGALIASFMLGAFSMIGTLVFLGCPWRMWLRISGGYLSAIARNFGFLVS